MYEINMKFPMPNKVVEGYAAAIGITSQEAVQHFEKLFENAIKILTPKIMDVMKQAEELALEHAAKTHKQPGSGT